MSAIVSISIVGASAEMLREPEIHSRGWVDGDEGDLLRKDATLAVRSAVEEALAEGKHTRDELERVVRRALGRFHQPPHETAAHGGTAGPWRS